MIVTLAVTGLSWQRCQWIHNGIPAFHGVVPSRGIDVVATVMQAFAAIGVREAAMRMSRRSVLTGALALGLTGCGSRDEDPLAGKDIAPPSEPVQIEWLAQSLTADDGADLRRVLVDLFHTRHRNITVRISQAPASSDVQRATLTTQIASGATKPDIFLGDCAWPAQFAHNSLALPMRRLVQDSFWDDFAQPVVRSLTYQGQQWAFPMYLSESFLLYRADLLAKHGMSPPRTWEELATAARELVRSGDARYGLVWQGASSETLTCNVAELIADAGGRLVTDDYGAAAVDSSAGRRALEFIDELMRGGASPRSVGTFSEQESLTAFTSGQAAFMRNWSYGWASATDPAESEIVDKVGIKLRPVFEGTGRDGLSTVGGWHNFINPHTEQLGAALVFARWLAGPEAQTVMGTRSTYLPASLTALDSSAIKKLPTPIFDLVNQVDLVPRPTATPFYAQLSEAIYTRVNPVVIGSEGTDGVLPAVADGINAALRGAAL